MVEAQPVVNPGERLPSLSFLTLSTVEGIVGGANPAELGGQSTWEAKVEKFMHLSNSYSTNHTISGETCYVVDKTLYENLLLAVVARKQNEQMISDVVKRMEEHMGQIESSHDRVTTRAKEAVDEFVLVLNKQCADGIQIRAFAEDEGCPQRDQGHASLIVFFTWQQGLQGRNAVDEASS
jgi:hypothetical protein